MNLFVSSLERSVQYYTTVCGITKVFQENRLRAAFLSNGDTHHDVGLIEAVAEDRVGRDGKLQISSSRGSRAGLNHLAFEVETEAKLVDGYRRFIDAGARVDRALDHMVARSLYLYDPEGNYLELYADTTPGWRRVFSAHDGELVTTVWNPLDGEPNPERQWQAPDKPLRVPNAPLAPRRIARAVLTVHDMAAMAHFYTAMLGFAPVATGPGDRYVILRGDASNADLVLLRARIDEPPGFHHVAFELDPATDLDRAFAELQSSGARAVLARSSEGTASIVLADPDGFVLEFFHPTTPAAGHGAWTALRDAPLLVDSARDLIQETA